MSFARLQRGEEITICCLGGSVTEGAVSTKGALGS